MWLFICKRGCFIFSFSTVIFFFFFKCLRSVHGNNLWRIFKHCWHLLRIPKAEEICFVKCACIFQRLFVGSLLERERQKKKKKLHWQYSSAKAGQGQYWHNELYQPTHMWSAMRTHLHISGCDVLVVVVHHVGEEGHIIGHPKAPMHFDWLAGEQAVGTAASHPH